MGEPSSIRNVVILGTGFLLVLAAFLTMAAIQQAVLKGVQDDDPTFSGDGCLAMTLINGVFALTNFLAPMIIAFLGVRTSMLVGSVVYIAYTAGFLYPNELLLYGTSAVLGVASAVTWVANGIYFTRCCNKDNIGRNMGIYWVLMASGQIFGNIFVSWKFQGKTRIDKDTRFMVVLILTVIAGLATICLAFLGPSRTQKISDEESEKPEKEQDEEKNEKPKKSLCTTLAETFKILRDRRMQLLIPSSIYSGLEIAFFVGIFPTTVGFTEAYGEDAKKLVGYVGILTAIGNVSGGLIFGVFGDKVVNSRRDLTVIIASCGYFVFVILVYLNFPNEAPLGPTLETSWITSPSISIALLCAFLLGLGEGSLTPQVIAAIGVIWPEDPSAANAMFRFFQAASTAGGFFISTLLGLYSQLMILLVVVVVGAITYCINERLLVKQGQLCKQIK